MRFRSDDRGGCPCRNATRIERDKGGEARAVLETILEGVAHRSVPSILAEVFHPHDAGVRRLVFMVEKGSTVVGYG